MFKKLVSDFVYTIKVQVWLIDVFASRKYFRLKPNRAMMRKKFYLIDRYTKI